MVFDGALFITWNGGEKTQTWCSNSANFDVDFSAIVHIVYSLDESGVWECLIGLFVCYLS